MTEMPKNLLQGWNIVVIDDEEDSLLVAQILLEEYGAITYTATNGEEGLELIRDVRPNSSSLTFQCRSWMAGA